MKLTFLGVGDSASLDNSNSNLLVESGDIKLVIDCGRSAFASVDEYGSSLSEITHILLTHIHNNSTGGLEEGAFMTKFVFKYKISLLGTSTLLDRLWQCSLRGGLEYIEEVPGDLRRHSLEDYYQISPLAANQWQALSPNFRVCLHSTPHIQGVESYGVEIEETLDGVQRRVFFSGNTKLSLSHLEKKASQCSLIFHDCQLRDLNKDQVEKHASYQQLSTLAPESKEKMWLYRYEDGPHPDAQKDGFAGFAKHLQSFTL